MIEIINKSETIERHEYYLSYDYVDKPGAGFSFPCEKDGTPIPSKHKKARSNRKYVTDHPDEFIFKGIVHYDTTYTRPAIGRCECGEEVTLDGFTCPCECGRDYNSFGQLLSPRSQWGYETGEHPADVARIP